MMGELGTRLYIIMNAALKLTVMNGLYTACDITIA